MLLIPKFPYRGIPFFIKICPVTVKLTVISKNNAPLIVMILYSSLEYF
jgi:hypothetical protein